MFLEGVAEIIEILIRDRAFYTNLNAILCAKDEVCKFYNIFKVGSQLWAQVVVQRMLVLAPPKA